MKDLKTYAELRNSAFEQIEKLESKRAYGWKRGNAQNLRTVMKYAKKGERDASGSYFISQADIEANSELKDLRWFLKILATQERLFFQISTENVNGYVVNNLFKNVYDERELKRFTPDNSAK